MTFCYALGFWISSEQQMIDTFDATLTAVTRNEHSHETYQAVVKSNKQVANCVQDELDGHSHEPQLVDPDDFVR